MKNKNIYRNYVNLKSGQVHIRISGKEKNDRRPLVCFHLSPVSGIIFEKLMMEMGQDRLIIAPDTPGFGMSDYISSEPTIRDYAKVMKDLINKLKIQNLDIMGYHTGSKICVELANLIQERINHLILISAPIYKKNELEEQHKNMGNYTAPKGDGSHLIKAWNGLWKWRGPNQMPTDIMKIFPDQIKGGHKSHWGHKAAFSYTYPERIKNIKIPILVINTKDDLFNYTKRIKKYLINGKIFEKKDWGHGFLDHNTKEIAKYTRNFLDKNEWPREAP
ncbi:MAG: hypothetical protein CBC47_07525 [Alphaproteobacteria bacterium TMED87]|nr:hypothetical protein [Rhodospirillaceae bacterium]OUV08461.1 MAG: hypothetical protein CBC47_07525 [Alphaproteobacteria bacterium TMED87]